MLSAEEMREKLIKAEESGRYFLYSKRDQLDSMSYEELETEYINMQNYLSDIATHSEY